MCVQLIEVRKQRKIIVCRIYNNALHLCRNIFLLSAILSLFFISLRNLVVIIVSWKSDITADLALWADTVCHKLALLLIFYQPLLLDEFVSGCDWKIIRRNVKKVEKQVIHPYSFLGLILHFWIDFSEFSSILCEIRRLRNLLRNFCFVFSYFFNLIGFCKFLSSFFALEFLNFRLLLGVY